MNEEKKIFCISFQRTGTTSVGKFFRDFGFKWAGWPADRDNKWSHSWLIGDYESIFNSDAFKSTNAYEDSPWWLPDFYKILYHRFPNSKFILLSRNLDRWFQSMINHSKGNVLGDMKIHCKVYRRELEYYDLVNSGIINEKTEYEIHAEKPMKLIDYAEHYKEIYRLHQIEVIDFFEKVSPNSLFVGRLEDPLKWTKMGHFLNIEVPADYDSVENISK